MKIHLDTPPEEIQIQIIPLIDVIFCILTFFILAALQLTRQQAIDVDVPKASTGAPQTRDLLIVTINSTGQTYVEKDLVDRNQLFQVLQNYHQRNPNGLLVLNASRMSFYNDVVQVIDVMRSVGGDRVALATQPADTVTPPGATPTPLITPTVTPTVDPYNLFGTPTPAPSFNPNQFQSSPTPGVTPDNSLTTPPRRLSPP
jgi:biopolymer transport protein ExbD